MDADTGKYEVVHRLASLYLRKYLRQPRKLRPQDLNPLQSVSKSVPESSVQNGGESQQEPQTLNPGAKGSNIKGVLNSQSRVEELEPETGNTGYQGGNSSYTRVLAEEIGSEANPDGNANEVGGSKTPKLVNNVASPNPGDEVPKIVISEKTPDNNGISNILGGNLNESASSLGAEENRGVVFHNTEAGSVDAVENTHTTPNNATSNDGEAAESRGSNSIALEATGGNGGSSTNGTGGDSSAYASRKAGNSEDAETDNSRTNEEATKKEMTNRPIGNRNTEDTGNITAQEDLIVTDSKVPNVIIFGETGAGKSSVINMLEGDSTAAVSSSAVGETFSSVKYDKTIHGQPFQIFDTVGLGEGAEGTVPSKEAIKSLYKLVSALGPGINLLVLVFRGRLTSATFKNYQMFFEIFCQRRVPIVIVITGLEREPDMDSWWQDNKEGFEQYGMKFKANACITTVKGRQVDGVWSMQEKYDGSKGKLEDLIEQAYEKKPWRMGTIQWFTAILRGLLTTSGLRSRDSNRVLTKALEENLGISRKDAEREAQLEDVGEKKEAKRKTSGFRFWKVEP